MNPTKVIVDQAEAALRLFFAESREDADRLLEMYGPLVHMFEQDVDAAVEVRSLVLDWFPSAEPPSVEGKDFLAPKLRTVSDMHGCEWRETEPNTFHLLNSFGQLTGTSMTYAKLKRVFSPLVEVPAPVKELPAAEAPTGHAAGDHSNCCACVCPDGAL